MLEVDLGISRAELRAAITRMRAVIPIDFIIKTAGQWSDVLARYAQTIDGLIHAARTARQTMPQSNEQRRRLNANTKKRIEADFNQLEGVAAMLETTAKRFDLVVNKPAVTPAAETTSLFKLLSEVDLQDPSVRAFPTEAVSQIHTSLGRRVEDSRPAALDEASPGSQIHAASPGPVIEPAAGKIEDIPSKQAERSVEKTKPRSHLRPFRPRGKGRYD